jgi:hypothetical protein
MQGDGRGEFEPNEMTGKNVFPERVLWIWILNPNPDAGVQKLPTNIEKSY